jgi:Transposase, Mutator family
MATTTRRSSTKTTERVDATPAEVAAEPVRTEEIIPRDHSEPGGAVTVTTGREPALPREARTRHNPSTEGVVMSLAAKGLANAQISAHLAETFGATISPEAVAKITNGVLDELTDWLTRPLEEIYPVIFIDAMVVKIRGGKVANRPVHTSIGVTMDGRREVLGLWIGEGGEGAKYWHQVLTEITNRGVNDVCFLICDGLRGLAEAVNTVWPQAIRADLRRASRPQHVPLRQPQRPATARPRYPSHLHRPKRSSRKRTSRRVRRYLG